MIQSFCIGGIVLTLLGYSCNSSADLKTKASAPTQVPHNTLPYNVIQLNNKEYEVILNAKSKISQYKLSNNTFYVFDDTTKQYKKIKDRVTQLELVTGQTHQIFGEVNYRIDNGVLYKSINGDVYKIIGGNIALWERPFPSANDTVLVESNISVIVSSQRQLMGEAFETLYYIEKIVSPENKYLFMVSNAVLFKLNDEQEKYLNEHEGSRSLKMIGKLLYSNKPGTERRPYEGFILIVNKVEVP